MGRREDSLRALWKFYQEVAGKYKHEPTAADMLCRDLEIVLIEKDMPILETMMDPFGGRVWLPREASTEQREFLIYYALADWAIDRELRKALSTHLLPPLTQAQLQAEAKMRTEEWSRRREVKEQYYRVKKEYWCNAFAVALLFANAGHDLLSAENHREFLTAGTHEEIRSPDYLGSVIDSYFGYRLRALNEEHFSPPNIRIAALADALIVKGGKDLAQKIFPNYGRP